MSDYLLDSEFESFEELQEFLETSGIFKTETADDITQATGHATLGNAIMTALLILKIELAGTDIDILISKLRDFKRQH